tara:strand:+ start:169 stop:411 length:243 start_codon:yes stop_codon:yes gene_type:complete
MTMFDIQDSKNVELDSNKTTKETLAKVKNVEGFKAKSNEAGIDEKSNSTPDDIVELKPNFFGIGINLRALWQKCIVNKHK